MSPRSLTYVDGTMILCCSEKALEITGNKGVEPAMEWYGNVSVTILVAL